MTFSWLEWLFYPILVAVIIIVGIISLSPAKKISEYVSSFQITLFGDQKAEKPEGKLGEHAAKMAVKDRSTYFRHK